MWLKIIPKKLYKCLIEIMYIEMQGVQFYESVIKAAVRKAKKDNSDEKPKVDAAIFCRLGHLLLLLEQYEKGRSKNE
jgi:hypothetical protein